MNCRARLENALSFVLRPEEAAQRLDGFFGDPVIGGNYFSFACMLDATMKGMGRVKFEEICVFQVKDGKVVSEQFFY